MESRLLGLVESCGEHAWVPGPRRREGGREERPRGRRGLGGSRGGRGERPAAPSDPGGFAAGPGRSLSPRGTAWVLGEGSPGPEVLVWGLSPGTYPRSSVDGGVGGHAAKKPLWDLHEAALAGAAGWDGMGWGLPVTCGDARTEEALPPCLLRACRIYVYTHRRMAITAEDVCLERVIPITEGFAVEEGNALVA